MKKLILLLFLLSISTYADISECSKTNIQDDKNYCMAKYAGSATFCDKIKSYGLRNQCMRMVVDIQRKSQYGIPPKEQKE
jgi:hypothetical protein